MASTHARHGRWFVPLFLMLGIGSTLGGIRAAAISEPTIPPPPAALTRAVPTGLRISADQCVRCHSVEPTLSHPVQVKPSMPIPSGFPLDGGKLSCTSCHVDSVEEHSHTEVNPFLLRQSAAGAEGGGGPAFCMECHASAAPGRRSLHALATSRAHLAWDRPRRSAALDSTASFDDGFRSCLSCHDGTMASDEYAGVPGVGGGARPTQPIMSMSDQGNHPVGIPYAARFGKALAPMSRLDRRTRLTDGQVTCNSCHSVYSLEPKLLAMSNRDSALCVSCHAAQ